MEEKSEEKSEEESMKELREKILKNVDEDRDKIQEHINQLYAMVEDVAESAVLDNLTSSLRAKVDSNAQLIKLLDIDVKKNKKSNAVENDDFLSEIIDE